MIRGKTLSLRCDLSHGGQTLCPATMVSGPAAFRSPLAPKARCRTPLSPQSLRANI